MGDESIPPDDRFPCDEWIQTDPNADVEVVGEVGKNDGDVFTGEREIFEIEVHHPDDGEIEPAVLYRIGEFGKPDPEATEQWSYAHSVTDWFDWRLYYIDGKRVEVLFDVGPHDGGVLKVAFGKHPKSRWGADEYPRTRSS